MKVTALKAHNY